MPLAPVVFSVTAPVRALALPSVIVASEAEVVKDEVPPTVSMPAAFWLIASPEVSERLPDAPPLMGARIEMLVPASSVSEYPLVQVTGALTPIKPLASRVILLVPSSVSKLVLFRYEVQGATQFDVSVIFGLLPDGETPDEPFVVMIRFCGSSSNVPVCPAEARRLAVPVKSSRLWLDTSA